MTSTTEGQAPAGGGRKLAAAFGAGAATGAAGVGAFTALFSIIGMKDLLQQQGAFALMIFCLTAAFSLTAGVVALKQLAERWSLIKWVVAAFVGFALIGAVLYVLNPVFNIEESFDATSLKGSPETIHLMYKAPHLAPGVGFQSFTDKNATIQMHNGETVDLKFDGADDYFTRVNTARKLFKSVCGETELTKTACGLFDQDLQSAPPPGAPPPGAPTP
jgi:hypothetical protein